MICLALELTEPMRRLFVAAARGQLAVAQAMPAHRTAPATWAAKTTGTLVAGLASVPWELPADVAAFTGRSAELARLDSSVLDAERGETYRPVVISVVSGTLVTSRDSLPGLVARDGARRLELDVLPADDAMALLRALIGERVDADPVARKGAWICWMPAETSEPR